MDLALHPPSGRSYARVPRGCASRCWHFRYVHAVGGAGLGGDWVVLALNFNMSWLNF